MHWKFEALILLQEIYTNQDRGLLEELKIAQDRIRRVQNASPCKMYKLQCKLQGRLLSYKADKLALNRKITGMITQRIATVQAAVNEFLAKRFAAEKATKIENPATTDTLEDLSMAELTDNLNTVQELSTIEYS